MKLTELAIEGYGVCRDLNLARFNRGLNIIIGETGSGKSTIRRFIRGVLYGIDSRHTSPPPSGSSFANGSLHVEHNQVDYRLQRTHASHELTLQPISDHAVSVRRVVDANQLTGSLTPDLFDTFFNVGFHDTRDRSYDLANCLCTRMGVPRGRTAVRDERSYARWQNEKAAFKEELDSIQLRIDDLTVEKREYNTQIEWAKTTCEQESVSIARQISDLSTRLEQISVHSIENEIAVLKSEISGVRDLIENTEGHIPLPVQQVAPVIGTHAVLYQRLDEIDNQIRRWRRVQADVQNQRLRLRDEMLIWNEMTLDSDEHPYHNARRILVALESRVDQAEHRVASWNSNTPATHETTARQLSDLCKLMREDIYGLCQELGHQYKHIRHKAAAAELKQLRRCYNEMGENTQRLVKRRESVVNEIRQVDPAGAEAIVHSEHKFCQCAQHEGYLEARRKYIGAVAEHLPVRHVEAGYSEVSQNLDVHYARLAELDLQLTDRQTALADVENERADLRTRQADLIRHHDDLLSQANRKDLIAKVDNIDVELRRLTDQYNEVSVRNDALTFVETPPNPILQRAANILGRVSLGDLTHVWLGEQTGEIIVQDRLHNSVSFQALSRGQKDQVFLSLCLASNESFRERGLVVPLLLDDVVANLDEPRVSSTLEILREHGLAGNQVFVFAKRNEIDRFPTLNLTVFELPQTGVTNHPFSLPERQPYFPGRATCRPNEPSESQRYHSHNGNVPVPDNVQPVSYPLTKYPRVGARAAVSAATFEEQNIVEERAAIPTDYAAIGIFREATLIGNDGIINIAQRGILNDFGIHRVRDLLNMGSADVETNLAQSGIVTSEFESWQSLYWLLICVPGMQPQDAKLLHACGITEPEQMDTLHSQQLLERLERYLASPDGRRTSNASYSVRKVNDWYRALDSTRARWQNQSWKSRHSSPRKQIFPVRPTHDAHNEPQKVWRPDVDQSRVRSVSPNVSASRRSPSRKQTFAVPTTPLVQSFTERQRSARPITARDSEATSKPGLSQNNSNSVSDAKLKFYLDLNDHVEAAPSIGPKTAERFEKIDVVTINDLLKQTAESMASKINYKRITANAIRNWQNQTRLVCRVPNLRGHDAQLLVACGITEPENLAVMDPKQLFDIIGPFSETKEGLKIIRSGKKPDFDEIADWIAWASHTRSLQAA